MAHELIAPAAGVASPEPYGESLVWIRASARRNLEGLGVMVE